MSSTREILAYRDRWLAATSSDAPSAGLVEATLIACREAVEQLGSRLIVLGYPWQRFLVPSPPDIEVRIARIESRIAVPIPEVIREFWRLVGGIALVDVQNYAHVEFWDSLGIQGAWGYCDGVYVDACDDNWVAYTIEDFEIHAEERDDPEDEDLFLYALAPDGYHKDDISGGPPYALGRGNNWAPTWENFNWAGYRRPETALADPPDFISYLRTAILECAGFPG